MSKGGLTFAQEHAQRALNNVRNLQPYLGDLADMVAIHVEPRIPTAGITADGRLFVNPDWFLSLSGLEAIYVIAHELWHLVLQSHARVGPADRWHVNVAHDWIINSILTDELEIMPPKNGLWFDGAGNHSAEELVRWLKDGSAPQVDQHSVWKPFAGASVSKRSSPFEEALRGSPLAPVDSAPDNDEPGDCRGDILTEADLARLSIVSIPISDSGASLKGDISAQAAARAETLRRASETALNTHAIVTAALQLRNPDFVHRQSSEVLDVIRTNDRIPIELALQRGIDMAAPNVRTFARASRRQGVRRDLVLPGRRTEGWAINLILDTSGSMTAVLPRLLSLIKASAAACGVSHVRIVQASDNVTADEIVDIELLERFEVRGYGGSDLTAAFELLGADPNTERVIVLSDMAIRYPETSPPFEVIWLAVRHGYRPSAMPTYGTFVALNM